MQKWMLHSVYYSLFALCLFLFTSFSLTAASHILMILPGLYFLATAVKEKKLQMSPSMMALLGLTASCIVSVVLNWDEIDRPWRNVFKAKYFLMAFLSIFAYRALIESGQLNRARVRTLFNALLFSTMVATISGLIGLYSGFNPLRMKASCHLSRACGMYGMYMTYGYGIGFFAIIASGLILFRNRLSSVLNSKLLWASTLINTAGLFLSLARGSIVAFLFIFPFLFARFSKKLILGLFTLFLVGGSILFLNSKKVQDVFTSVERVESVKKRLSQYQAAYYAFKSSPVFGIGYKNFEPQSKLIKQKENLGYTNFGGHAHNNFLEHLASTGFVGFIFLLLFHLFWIFEMFMRSDSVGYIAMPFVAYLFLTGMVQYTIGDGENLFLIMNFYALTQSIREKIL